MQARHRFRSTLGQIADLIALTLALAWPVRANDRVFTFTARDSASGTFSFGVLDVSANGDGTFTATGGFLVVVSGPDAGHYDLVPNPNPPNPFFSSSGAFLADDILYPGQDPSLDIFGLLFAGNGLEINIWGNSPGNYSYWSFNGGFFTLASDNAEFRVTRH
jgi:hypothetical protein